jgi:hypothetical protein
MQPDNRQEYFQKKEEEREARRDRLRFAAGMLEFLGVIVGAAVILMLVSLIISLVNWVSRDISTTFNMFGTMSR